MAPRDPVRSLVVGSIIAAAVLVLIAVLLAVVVYGAFSPRQDGRSSAGTRFRAPSSVPLH